MPSLFKYFTIVGGGLLGLLIALDTVMQPGGPGPSLVNVAAPKAVVERAPIALAPPPSVTQISEQPAAEQMISPTALTGTPSA